MIFEERKDHDSNQALIRRFTRRLRSSGQVNEIKGRRFFEKEPNKEAVRQKAIVIGKRRSALTLMKKKGIIDDQDRRVRITKQDVDRYA